jgi:hypothetical protein
MTSSNRAIAENLRRQRKKLEDKIEAVLKRIAEYERVVTLSDMADIKLIEDIKKILEAKE